jgi:DNA repair photolyase
MHLPTITRKTLLYRTGVEYGDWCLNHVEGCSHGCLYPCYAMLLKKRVGAVKSYKDWCKPKIVSNALELLETEIPKYKSKIKNVYLCFATDPFMYGQNEISELSIKIIAKLNSCDIPCIVLTKGTYPEEPLIFKSKINEYGITLVSLDESFRSKLEPYAAPLEARIEALEKLHKKFFRTWVSMEPYPTPNFIEQDISTILDKISFVNKIVFGRLNYNRFARGYSEFYKKQSEIVRNFCSKKDIEFYLKENVSAAKA